MRVLIFSLCIVACLAQVSLKRGNGCVRWINPTAGVVLSAPTGPFSQGAYVDTHCDMLDLAGNRGLFVNGSQSYLGGNLTDPVARREAKKNMVRQTFNNMLANANFSGAGKWDISNLVVMCWDLAECRPIVNEVEIEIWGPANVTFPNHPPRTIVGDISFNGLYCVDGNDGDDLYNFESSNSGQALCSNGKFGVGDLLEIKGRFWVRHRPHYFDDDDD